MLKRGWLDAATGEPPMPGKVYCFNAYNEPLQLTVNGASAGSVPSWGGAGPYAPAALAVPRARHADGQPGAFPNDRPTPLRLAWDSYEAMPVVNLAGLPNVSLDDDLILFIAVNQITLMNTRGFVLLTTPVEPRMGG